MGVGSSRPALLCILLVCSGCISSSTTRITGDSPVAPVGARGLDVATRESDVLAAGEGSPTPVVLDSTIDELVESSSGTWIWAIDGAACVIAWSVNEEEPEGATSRVEIQGGGPAVLLVDAFEVTVSQFRRYCVATGAIFPTQPAGSSGAHPVVSVSREDAESYAKWAGRRLMTVREALEFQGALASALQDDQQPGEGRALGVAHVPELGDSGWVALPVGQSDGDPPLFGVHDLRGNAREWVSSDSASGGLGRAHVMGWCDVAFADGESIRLGGVVGVDPALRDCSIGFRCVRVLRARRRNAPTRDEHPRAR